MIKDAGVMVKGYAHSPVMLTSYIIDAYGDASKMEKSTAVNDGDILQGVWSSGLSEGECFDADYVLV